MSISYGERVAWPCGHCHHRFEIHTWLAIDVVERHDLRVELGKGSIIHVDCPSCGKKVLRPAPLLITRMAKRLPVAVAANPDTHSEPLESISHVVEKVRGSFGSALADVPGPALIIPFEWAEAAARSDIDSYFEDSGNDGGDKEAIGRLLEEIAASEPLRRVHLALNKIRMVKSRENLDSLLTEYPEVTSEAVREALKAEIADAKTPEERDLASICLTMVERLASGDVDAAWDGHVEGLRAMWRNHMGPRYDLLIEELEGAESTGDPEKIILAGREVLAFIPPGTWPEIEGQVSSSVADALSRLPGPGRSERIEDAIAHYQRVLSILDDNPGLDVMGRRAVTLGNLGAAYGQRARGDPAVNLERSISLLRQSLGLLTRESDGDRWAMANTNLALSLAEREEGDRESNLAEAANHLKAALTWRSFERNPLDWAYTHLNLGLIFARRKDGGPPRQR